MKDIKNFKVKNICDGARKRCEDRATILVIENTDDYLIPREYCDSCYKHMVDDKRFTETNHIILSYKNIVKMFGNK